VVHITVSILKVSKFNDSYLFDQIWMMLPLKDYLIIGAVTGFLAVVSDLFESFLKRCAGVKVTHFQCIYQFF
jgi:CDP-diglyceride synthetase